MIEETIATTTTKATKAPTKTPKSTEEKREKIYECEVKRRRRTESGTFQPFWKLKSVQEAVEDEDTEFRCKDCHGRVKLFRKRLPAGPASHVEHLMKEDSEYCPGGMYFRRSTDGREPRMSEAPVK
jgi:hypothetical protein